MKWLSSVCDQWRKHKKKEGNWKAWEKKEIEITNSSNAKIKINNFEDNWTSSWVKCVIKEFKAIGKTYNYL